MLTCAHDREKGDTANNTLTFFYFSRSILNSFMQTALLLPEVAYKEHLLGEGSSVASSVSVGRNSVCL